MNKPAPDVDEHVQTCIECAIDATRNEDIEHVVDWIAMAIAIYEENPRAAREPENRVQDLLAVIRIIAGLCASLERPHEDVRDLEARAERLAVPLH